MVKRIMHHRSHKICQIKVLKESFKTAVTALLKCLSVVAVSVNGPSRAVVMCPEGIMQCKGADLKVSV